MSYTAGSGVRAARRRSRDAAGGRGLLRPAAHARRTTRRSVIQTVNFPVDLFGGRNTVQAGYAPNFLPGVRFGPGFFSHIGNSVLTYPSRWAFADFLALDVGVGAPGACPRSTRRRRRSRPSTSASSTRAAAVPCAGTYVLHDARVPHVGHGAAARGRARSCGIRVGEPVEKTIVDYRIGERDRRLPVGRRRSSARGSTTLARAPLIKADMQQGRVPPFADWSQALDRLPSPSLIHPVAFGPGRVRQDRSGRAPAGQQRRVDRRPARARSRPPAHVATSSCRT